MFETEAGFAETKMLINCHGDYSKKQDYKKGWQDGAEFAYNKANEWQKDLPTEDIRLAIIEVEDCGYILCNYRNGFWYEDNSGATCAEWITNNIVRWKEIVLPGEVKE